MLAPLKNVKRKYRDLYDMLAATLAKVDSMQQSLGRVEERQIFSTAPHKALRDYEYQVYSQFGEDGIIQMLTSTVKVKSKTFVEFGVEDYQESNTRYLLRNGDWAGLVLDGDEKNIQAIRQSSIYWRHNLKAEKAFINRENINSLLEKNGMTGDIGLLSVDIDGNDYWVWKNIKAVNPAIVIVEYNCRFGPKDAVTVPYRKDFMRDKAHYSMIYFGASLKAFCLLAEEKGYDFVGCSSSGVNAFFVKKELRPKGLPALTCEQGYVEHAIREARDREGNMAYLSRAQEQNILAGLPLVRVE